MDLAAFRTKYPEWNTAQPDSLVQSFLDEAARAISVEVTDTRFDDAHGYLTAHLLAKSPHGKNSRLAAPADKETTYWKEYMRITYECTAGLGRVI